MLPEVWTTFVKTAGMLAIVIAALLLLLYLVRRFSSAGGVKGAHKYIQVLSIHHFSPKEKVVLLEVLDQKILVGVTPQRISKIADISGSLDTETIRPDRAEVPVPFSKVMSGVNRSFFTGRIKGKVTLKGNADEE